MPSVTTSSDIRIDHNNLRVSDEARAHEVSKWSVDEVAGWAAKEGFGFYAGALQKHAISGKVLPVLTDANLREIGFELVGPRIEFQQALKHIQRGARMAQRNEVLWEADELRLGPCGGVLPWYFPCCCVAQPPAHYKLNHYKLQLSEAVVPCGGLCACLGYSLQTDNLELSELEDIDVQITHPTCGYGEGIITVTTKEGLSRHLKVNTKEATDACQKIQMAHEEAELRMTQIQISGAPGQAF